MRTNAKALQQDRFRKGVPQLFLMLSVLLACICTIAVALTNQALLEMPKTLWLLPIWFGFFIAWMAFPFVLGFFISLCLPKQPKKEHGIARWFALHVIEVLLLVGRIHVRFEGLEKLDPDEQYLFVSNHLSMFDPMINMVYLAHYRPLYITKLANMKIPLAGPFIRFLRFMSIDRDNPRRAIATIHEATELAQSEEKYSIGLYPEGTRSKTGELLPFHEGVFLIANRTPMPVCVMQVIGTEHISKNFPLHKTNVTVKVVEIIDREFVTSNRSGDVSAKAFDILQAAKAEQ